MPILLKPTYPRAISGIGRDYPSLNASGEFSFILGKTGDSDRYPRVTTEQRFIRRFTKESGHNWIPQGQYSRNNGPVTIPTYTLGGPRSRGPNSPPPP